MVEPLDFLDDKELLGFLHVNKTELSCMDNPQTFVGQLRDYGLISKERHGKINRMKSKETIRAAVYDVLDFIETEHAKLIKRFWRCAFKETILSKYPTLRLLRNSLFDGSYQSESALLDEVADEDTNVKDVPEKKGKEVTNGKKRKKASRAENGGDEEGGEEPSTSAQVTPRRRKTPKKPCFSSPLKRGEKGDIWTWAIYKVQLPVTCGEQRGSLNRARLARGDKCILVDKRWYSPTEFERLAGKAANKNWKMSIRCRDTSLGKLIQDGHLKCARFSRGASKMAKKRLFPSEKATAVSVVETDDSDSESEEGSSYSTEESKEEDEGQLKLDAQNNANRVLRVACEDILGLLHTNRFASGERGKSIRTEDSWLTPVNFVKEASCQTDTISWKRHIKCEGRPLGELLKEKILKIHSLLCRCSRCVPGSEDLDNEKNDDECWICRKEGTEEQRLVECDECPRSFHQQCHLPHVQDALLNDERPWMCTLCVFGRALELYPERHMDEAMASTISAHMLHCQYLLLGLYRADEDFIFKLDPCALPDYSRVIQTPMWLDHIADKLQNNKYQTVCHFESDTQLIFQNCTLYNRDNLECHDIGIKMKDFFVKEFNKVFKIRPMAS